MCSGFHPWRRPLSGQPEGARTVDHDYLSQIARAAESLGFDGALIPTGRSCEDPWVTASSLIPLTRKLKFLVAVRPGIMSPTVAARMAASFDRHSNGRLLINVVAGGDPVELAGDGCWLSHDERYEAASEFLDVWKGVLSGQVVDLEGKHITVKGAQQLFPPGQPAASAGVFWRLVAGSARPGRPPCGFVPELGRAAGRGGEKNRRPAPARRRLWPHVALWPARACDCARQHRRSLARSGRLDQQAG